MQLFFWAGLIFISWTHSWLQSILVSFPLLHEFISNLCQHPPASSNRAGRGAPLPRAILKGPRTIAPHLGARRLGSPLRLDLSSTAGSAASTSPPRSVRRRRIPEAAGSAAACLTCVRPQRGPRSCLGPPASSNRARRGVLCPATGSTPEQPDSTSTASPAFVCCVGAAAREPSSISLPCCVGHPRRWCRRSSGGIDASIGS
ncbi:uncharacterized protein [Triticum aestivum]|uniref:uncharacterized protein n=1 Tax=Triticum aestivum TaxID=4565 RepID=UPI001D026F02|nr:uncharacterized protein LOC123090651 [Triticum aestivum]